MSVQSSPVFALRNLIILFACVAAMFVARPASAETPDDEPVAASTEGVVNINTATVDQLRLLPRVGEEKAQRIIAHREKTPFKTVNEFARVHGIGLKTLRALKPWLTIQGPTTLKSKVRLAKKARTAPPEARTRATPDAEGPR